MKSILDLLRQDGLKPTKVSNIHGGEYASPCPECAGNDRFRCWPKESPEVGGRYWCRGCGKQGDTIQYLHVFRGMGYKDACKALGVEPKDYSENDDVSEPERPAWTPKAASIPPDVWQAKTEALTAWAESKLRGPEGEAALAFLHGRGLTDATIKAARLGWNPQDVFRDREAWGLPVELKEDGSAKRLWIPAGLVIPVFSGDKVARIKIRTADRKPPYFFLPGGANVPMVIGDASPCLVVESELDGILMNQVAGNIITSIALGSVTNRPDIRAAERLKAATVILVALDSDEAGAKESWRWWPEHFPQARRWPLPGFKDPSEAYQGGFPLRTWVEAGLAEYGQNEAPQSKHSPDPLPLILPEARSAVLGQMDGNTSRETGAILGIEADAFEELCRTVPPELAEGLRLAAGVFPDAALIGFEPDGRAAG